MDYLYYFDSKNDTLFDRISGSYFDIGAFEKSFLNPDFMKRYVAQRFIISDLRQLDFDLEDYKDEILNLWQNYDSFVNRGLTNIEKGAILINNTNALFTALPFKRSLTEKSHSRTKYFQDIDQLSDFIGFDTSKYFFMRDNELSS